MKTKTPYLTVALCSGIAFVFTLLLYVLVFNRNPLNRFGYGVYVSLVPALTTLVYAKLRGIRSRNEIALIYFLLFLVVVNIQSCAR